MSGAQARISVVVADDHPLYRKAVIEAVKARPDFEFVEEAENGGYSAPEIAERLTLSPTTVRTHLHYLYNKLGVSDRAAAVAEAMRRGLLE